MTSPAQPAQPAQPITPEELGRRTGGYTGPSPRGADPASIGPIPGGTPLGTPTPGAYPSAGAPGVSPSSPSPYAAPAAAPGLPPAAQALGLDQEGYDSILADMRASPDQAEFQTQFSSLMDQKGLVARPKGVQGRYHVMSEDQSKHWSKWMREAVAYATVPKDFGGLGYTEGEAKMKAIMEAKRRNPNIDPSAWATMLPGGELSQRELGHVKLADKQAPIEVGPRRAARLGPSEISDILLTPELKMALEWAREYKQRVGTAANAVDFVQDVYNQQVAKTKTHKANLQTSLARYRAYAEQKEAETEASGGDVAAYRQKAAANVAAKLAEIQAADVPDSDIVAELSNRADILSVAAALAQLY